MGFLFETRSAELFPLPGLSSVGYTPCTDTEDSMEQQTSSAASTQLFQDRDGHLVQVIEQNPDTVQFCAQGGGFVFQGPRAAFERDFTPAPLPGFRAARFTADWLDEGTTLVGFTDGLRWNGWAMPYFSREVGLRLCSLLPSLTFDAERNAFVSVCEDYPEDEQEEAFAVRTVEVDGKQLELYAIGAGSWTWDEIS